MKIQSVFPYSIRLDGQMQAIYKKKAGETGFWGLLEIMQESRQGVQNGLFSHRFPRPLKMANL